ncbi:hypothetical protein D3870_11985 [Noviherbaspirillum cavernae]|uniref:Uncharacterized protein n=1 Tax=Noviherbaspirillum cavernae TaxID=2320862 RepID=A0A418X2H7_9BURK|nr:hypothetical protein D3870_11985 [Noviherbaspirillum cavernae]
MRFPQGERHLQGASSSSSNALMKTPPISAAARMLSTHNIAVIMAIPLQVQSRFHYISKQMKQC